MAGNTAGSVLLADASPKTSPSQSLSSEALAKWKPPEMGSFTKQKAPPPKKREVKKKPPSPKARRKSIVQFDRNESFAPDTDELEELLRTAGNRMPGRFGDGGLFLHDPDEDPAMRFVLKKKQPPKRVELSKPPLATRRASVAAAPATAGVGKENAIKKSISVRSIRSGTSITDRGRQRRWVQRSGQDSQEESPHELDVYGLEGDQAGTGGISVSDGWLQSGAKVLVPTKQASRKKSFDFREMTTMQVIDPSFLGKTLVQEIQPLELTGRNIRYGSLVPLDSPVLSHIARRSLIQTDTTTVHRSRDSDDAIDSLMYLPSCNDAAIIDSLQQRFSKGLYFTCCDNMLIFVNPWESQQSAVDAIFNHTTAVQYWTAHIAKLPSHPYLFARRAFSNAKRQHRNQLVLTLGSFGCGQDRVHHELVKLFIKFAFTMQDTWTDEEVRAAELARDSAVCLLDSLHITYRGGLFGGRLMDLFQVELDADGDVVGFGFLPNSSYEASQDIISWQMRESFKSVPLPNIFYHILYAIHFNPDDPVLKSTCLHPVDVTELLQYFPPPNILYEDIHYEKCQQLLSGLSAIGLSNKQRTEFLRIISAIMVADVVSFKRHHEAEEGTPQEVQAPTAPRVQRITKQKQRRSEASLLFGQKTGMTLAGLDIISLLANLLEVEATVLRDMFFGTDVWQVRFLALKLFVRLRWWLLGMISQSLRISKGTEVHNRITLLKAVGLDFRRVGQEWALNQLLHNYTEECFLHLFATWAFTLDQATYLLEGVKPPPAHFRLNDDIVDVFAGPDGIWHIMRAEHANCGGEAAEDLSEGVPLAAISFVDKILKSKGSTDKILEVPGYQHPSEDILNPKFAVRVVKATAKGRVVARKGTAVAKPQASPHSVDPALSQFIVVHTSGSLVYDATKFCTSDANAYTVPNRLRTLLLQSRLELLRTLVQHEATHDVIPTDCLRISVANRLIQYAKDSLSEGTEAPQTNFIVCVSSLRSLLGAEPNQAGPSSIANYQRQSHSGRPEENAKAQCQKDVHSMMTFSLRHEPQVPPRIAALMATEAKLGRSHSTAMQGFDAIHVWKQLNDLQILTYCATRYLGMTVRLPYEEFLELYAVLCIPTSYAQQTTSLFVNYPSPKAASAFLLQALKFPNTGYQLGRSMVFFRKAAFLVLEKRRIDYLERVVPAVTRIQRVWRTVRERAFVADMRWLCIRVQSHARRILLLQEQKKLKPLKHFFVGAVLLSGIAFAFRRLGLSDEAINSIKLKYRNREVYCLRWSAAVCVQSWWRSILAQKQAAKLRQAVLLEHCSILVQCVSCRTPNAERLEVLQSPGSDFGEDNRGENPESSSHSCPEALQRMEGAPKIPRIERTYHGILVDSAQGGKALQHACNVKLPTCYSAYYGDEGYDCVSPHDETCHSVHHSLDEVQLDSSVVRVQSFFRMAIVRQQYLRLRNAAMLCQAGAWTRLRRGDFLLAKRMVVKLQRWWRSILLLRGLDAELALPPPVRMPKKSDSVVMRREVVAFELLRPHMLTVQGTFRTERSRHESQFAYPVRLQPNCDCRSMYPRTWAQPLQDLLTQTATATSHQQSSYLMEAVQIPAPVTFMDISIGGHHTLVLLAVRQPASGNFATRVRTVVKGGGWQDFTVVPKVYAWGWGDRGQLGKPQRPADQGLSCVGPLTFVDRVFKQTMNLETGHLVEQLVREVDYTHRICAVAAGLDHSVALTNEGMVFSWGDNSEGQCGLGHRLMTVRHPTLLPTIRNNGIKVKSIAAGPRHTGAVCTDGKALMWGASHFVRLPTVLPDSHSYTPREVPLDPCQETLQICCSSGFNVLRTARTNGVFVWGRNDSGQLGQGVDDKKSRDLPIFVPLPATPAHPHLVSKVATGTSFVVVSLQKKSSFLYTWGAISAVEAPDASSGSSRKAAVGGKKAPAEPVPRENVNPFLKLTGSKTPQPQLTKTKAAPTKVGELKAVCKPTRVEHSLWKDDPVIDIGASGTEVLVLFESNVLYGYTWLEVNYTQRAPTHVNAEQTSVPVQSFFFKKETPESKPKVAPAEKPLSCEVERLRGEFTLQPGIYSLRHLKPLRMAIRSIHTSGNAVSLSFTWVKAVRPTRQVLDDLCEARESPFFQEHTTASGAPVELPKKVIERAQKKHKEIVDWSNNLLSRPYLSRENQSRQSALPTAETLVPDPRLLHRMRSIYSTHNAQSSSPRKDAVPQTGKPSTSRTHK